jgi:hypothetical protein
MQNGKHWTKKEQKLSAGETKENSVVNPGKKWLRHEEMHP